MIRGKPFFIRLMGIGLFTPKHTIPGGDLAGMVEAVGKKVKQFQPGDDVYGDIGEVGHGAFAEYVSVPENVLVHKPSNLTYEEAASVPQYALVALQGLRDNGHIQSGHKVLINGASGGVGTFAVQVAKSYGAEVTGVCSTRNLELVRSIGADHVIDYTKEDFAKKEQRYDLILDSVANRPISDYTGVLTPNGHYVAVAFNVRALITGGKKVNQLSHEPNAEDLVFMKELIEAGKVVPVIDKSYPLSDITKAFRYFEEEHPTGKVVITMKDNAEAI
jgi:NADPH:quinone reductase-like Zn-dependent oxidoreductase